MRKTKFPKSLFRNSDGQEFRHTGSGIYSIFVKGEYGCLGYSYQGLIKCGFKHRLEDCSILPPAKKRSGGCGDYDSFEESC